LNIPGLWLRLADRPHFTCVLDDKSKSFFWNVIRQIEDVEMYELPVARSPLVIFNRYDHVDPELGMVLEPAEIPKDIYPHCAIEDGKIRGSCSTYKERKNVTNVARYLTLDEALQKWDLKLVLVATQQARNTALMGHNVNPSMELTAMQYCVLERIGRSRYLGEVTQGKVSLQLVGEDPKALFYHRKFLIRHKLIAKQVHHQKSGSQNCSGSLLHLPRFRVDRKPKALYLTEKVVEILKTRPNCIAEYEEIRKELGLANSLKKLFKTFDFQRFVRTDLRLPYRELYPEASVAEWKHKANDKEKKIRVVQLINPDMDVREIWAKDDEIEEEDDATSGLLDTSKILLDRPILNQAFSIVENSGPEGLSQMELSDKMGVSKLQARTLCRNLIKKGAVSTFMNDVGRQRVCRYISKKYIKEGKLSVEFMREKNKMLTLVGLKTEKESQSKAKKKHSAEEKKLLNKKRAHEEGPEKNSPDAKRIKSETNEIIQTTQLEVSAPVEESTVTAQTDTSEQRIETKIILEGAENSQGEKDYHVGLTEELLKMDVSNKDTPNITYRILRRANIIIEAVRTHTVIDDLTKLMKHINEEEGKEGYNSKIDKKSLLRLLAKLSKDGHIKVIKIVLKGGNKEKMLSFVCEPDITTGDSFFFYFTVQTAVHILPNKAMKRFKKKRTETLEEVNDGVTMIQLLVNDDWTHITPDILRSSMSEALYPVYLEITSEDVTTTNNPAEGNEFQSLGRAIVKEDEYEEVRWDGIVSIVSWRERVFRLWWEERSGPLQSVRSIGQVGWLIPDLPRKSSVAAFRLATGHDCLAKHLHRIGIYQSPNYPLCNSNQEMDSEHLKICASLASHDNIFEKYWSARDHSLIQSAVEQAKMKFFILGKERLVRSYEGKGNEDENFSSESIHKSMDEMKAISSSKEKLKSPKFVYDSRIGKKYGFAPKFVRMQILHQFLFYVIYGYVGNENLDQEAVIRRLQLRDNSITDEVTSEMSKIYHEEVDWKMFIPPLPKHAGWPDGWAIMCDLLLRLPLCTFVKIFNVSFIIPGLEQYLLHPIRRNYLVRHLPSHLRNALTIARRYIFSIHEVMQRLCYVGLIQFGPQRLKEKDQVFIFLNRKTTLLDTTPSRPGYHQVSEDVEYAQHKYEFHRLDDIDKYWYEMWNFCIHTQLGNVCKMAHDNGSFRQLAVIEFLAKEEKSSDEIYLRLQLAYGDVCMGTSSVRRWVKYFKGGRMYVTGKDIVLEVLQNKQAMIDAIQPRQPRNALELDTGNVPGDKRGAAGLDSAFFSHLKRNWNWTNTSKTLTSIADENVSTYEILTVSDFQSIKPRVEEQRKARLASLKTEPLQFGEIFQKPSDKPSQFRLSNVKKKIVSRKIEPKKHAVEPKRREEKKKKVVRHVLPRQKKKRVHRPYYDEVDMEALKLMSKLRVEWSITEDNLLLLCKVAVMYLCPFPRKQIINFQTIRDVLHKICPSSHNKTSRACQRRILYMMKNKSTAHSVALHLEEVRQDPEIIKQFNNTIQELKSKTDDIEEMEKLAAEKFKVLVSVLQRKFNPHPSDYKQTGNCIPVSLAEFKKQYELVYPSPTLKKRGRFQDVKNVVDIYCAIVNTIIHSSLCCATDKTSYTYQLFQVYQQYPDNLLRSAMAKIRSDQMVSLKKSYMRLKPKTGNYLPVSSSPYQLSISYVYQLQTKYQYDIFYESHLMTKKLRSWYMEHVADLEPALGLEVGVSDGGTAAALVELFTKKQMSFDIEIPEQVIILDPRVSEKDETYARIVQRYRDILRTYKSGKELVSSSIIFKKPFWDEKEKGKEVGEPSCSKDVDIDPDDVDGDDFDFDGIEETDEPQTSANQQNAIARVASRIALYMMREELGDSVLGEKQHAHDFFVVNSCKVFCKFHNPHRDNTEGHIIDDIGQITPMSVVSEVAGGTSHIKSTSNVSETLTDIAGKVSEECVNKEVSSQKQDHVNSQSQEDMPSEAMEVDQEVQEKLKTTIPVCAGDSEEKSVKYGSESDVNTQHQDSESVYGSPSASTSQNKDQNKPEDFLSGVPADLVPITQKEVKKILDDIGKYVIFL
ncbi:hypothetical protein ANN_00450, partial [Periplaneta americana]